MFSRIVSSMRQRSVQRATMAMRFCGISMDSVVSSRQITPPPGLGPWRLSSWPEKMTSLVFCTARTSAPLAGGGRARIDVAKVRLRRHRRMRNEPVARHVTGPVPANPLDHNTPGLRRRVHKPVPPQRLADVAPKPIPISIPPDQANQAARSQSSQGQSNVCIP